MQDSRPKAKKPAKSLQDTRDFLNMLRECGVMEYSDEAIQVKLLPKAVETSLHPDLFEGAKDELMQETREMLGSHKEEFDKDLFWSVNR